MQFEDDLNQLEIPAAFTVHAFASARIDESLRIVLRGENLLDRRVVAGVSSDGVTERATPRTLWLGLRFSTQGTSGTP